MLISVSYPLLDIRRLAQRSREMKKIRILPMGSEAPCLSVTYEETLDYRPKRDSYVGL
jgi:hypothetical protein